MFQMKLKRTNRIFVAATLILLFMFTSLFATYQSGKDFNEAYAAYSGSCSNDSGECVGVIDCVSAVANCVFLTLQANEICKQNGAHSPECIAAAAAAVAACANVPAEC